ncbi:guanine nucleotide-binding protein G(o) subunit alpha [Cryptococcus neoformans C23]|uniref:Guanine nucleotide-binding protein alpha-2 subunit n=3 Tax=Cryptococcus neoformans TaxID=5207 RepID=A0A854QC77_CRYNE|nr:guanine nucleotide-binding protein G(o) subunit alpha [Cryptococcus neoformans var. grubii H99]AAQ74379.2 G-protein alpha subunit Gpa3 [Cryptococcus neoformans var. grubii]OWZ40756.1 guanine nucleotide-binding protein G(o) subunit alpha [Cryptococcus neoformans var. grubii AD1-83a]OWZ43237.1 guanine nucleotide-binding protein G(o) subunit alpha [Cryptococcus neoformans var. grubii C23]OWZ54080.1 guanine nucleotide-binding protein G(o) subunit alpha [Cryptococcus neoformans var. grubii 125.91|eukprot:XP_012049936.1 guanine nucleotide-binding protein G(o) subunit alpha [Cryptococcus neoformans var. grubii H99]
MGGCMSSPATGDPVAEARSKEIDRALKEDEKRMAKEVKLLLLGAGASGKSTILKQMRLIHDRPFESDEVEDYRKLTFSNIVGGMRAIIDVMDELGLAVQPENRRYISLVDAEPPINTNDSYPIKYLTALKRLWEDPSVQECYKRGNEFALAENMPYFYADLDRLFAKGFKPSSDDILRVRSKTTGITETRFPIRDVVFRLFDVGGQRSERRKWASCFENVTAILFLVALSDYNSCLIEDRESNGMQEALMLFDSICNSQWFTKSSIILFLNKADLLQVKIQDPSQQLHENFPEFEGKPYSFQDAVDFFKIKFRSLNRMPQKEIYCHVTTAVDRQNVKVVMTACQDTILKNALRDMAIL